MEFLKWFKPTKVDERAERNIGHVYKAYLIHKSDEYHGLKVFMHDNKLNVVDPESNIYFVKDGVMTHSSSVIIAESLEAEALYLAEHFKDAPWSIPTIATRVIGTDPAAPLLQLFNNADLLMFDTSHPVYYIKGDTVQFAPGVEVKKWVDSAIDQGAKIGVHVSKIFQDGKELNEFSAKATVKTGSAGSEKEAVNAVLVSLKQPDLKHIHSTKGLHPTEDNLIEADIPTGGTAKQAFALVLALSINLHPNEAVKLLVSKPQALRNWLSIMSGDHLYGSTVGYSYLQNEYLKLLPYLLKESLGKQDAEKLENVRQEYLSKKPSESISKKIWE